MPDLTDIRDRITRLTLAAGLSRDVWSELCKIDSDLRAALADGCECHQEAGDSLCPVPPPPAEELAYAASIGAPYHLPPSPPHVNAELATIGPLMTQAEAEQLRAERAAERDDEAERVRAVVREAVMGCADLRGKFSVQGREAAADAIADRVAAQLTAPAVANPFCGVAGCPGGAVHAHDPCDWSTAPAAEQLTAPEPRDAFTAALAQGAPATSRERVVLAESLAIDFERHGVGPEIAALLRGLVHDLSTARAGVAALESELAATEEQRDVYRDRAQQMAGRTAEVEGKLHEYGTRICRDTLDMAAANARIHALEAGLRDACDHIDDLHLPDPGLRRESLRLRAIAEVRDPAPDPADDPDHFIT